MDEHKTEPDYQENNKERKNQKRRAQNTVRGTKTNESVEGKGYTPDSSEISVTNIQRK